MYSVLFKYIVITMTSVLANIRLLPSPATTSFAMEDLIGFVPLTTGVDVENGQGVSAYISKVSSVTRQLSMKGNAIVRVIGLQVDGIMSIQIIVTDQSVQLFQVDKVTKPSFVGDSRINVTLIQEWNLKDLDFREKDLEIISSSSIIEGTPQIPLKGKLALMVRSLSKGVDSIHFYDFSCRTTSLSSKEQIGSISIPYFFPIANKEKTKGGGRGVSIRCSLVRKDNYVLEPLYFTSKSPMKTLICTSAIDWMVFNSTRLDDVYLMRYCPLASLKIDLDLDYTNMLEIYQYSAKNLKMLIRLSEVDFSGTNIQFRILRAYFWKGTIMLFTKLGVIPIDQSIFQKKTITNFLTWEGDDVKCTIRKKTLACITRDNKRITSQDFIKQSDRVEKKAEKRINLSNNTTLLGTAGKFVVLKSEARKSLFIFKEKDDKLSAELNFPIQDGEILEIYSIDNRNKVSKTHSISYGFMIAETPEGFSVSVLIVRKPFLVIYADKVPTKKTCLKYLKGCQEISVKISDLLSNVTLLSLSFYHVQHNFTAVLPTFVDKQLTLLSYRNKIKVNISQLFLGLPMKTKLYLNEDELPSQTIEGEFSPKVKLLDPTTSVWSDKFIKFIDLNFQSRLMGEGLTKKTYKAIVSLIFSKQLMMLATSDSWMVTLHLLVVPQSVSNSRFLSANSVDYQQLSWYGKSKIEVYQILRGAVAYIDDSPHIVTRNSQGYWTWLVADENLRVTNAISFKVVKEVAHPFEIFLITTKNFIRILQVAEDDSGFNNFVTFSTVTLEDLEFYDFEAAEIQEAYLSKLTYLYVIASDKDRQRVLAIYQCEQKYNLNCNLIGQTPLLTEEERVILYPNKCFWIINPTTTKVQIFDLYQISYDYERVYGMQLVPSRTSNLKTLLGNSKIIVEFTLKDCILIASQAVITIKIAELNNEGKISQSFLLSMSLGRTSNLLKLRSIESTYNQSAMAFQEIDSYSIFYKTDKSDQSIEILLPQSYYGVSLTNLGPFQQTAPEEYKTRLLNMIIESTAKTNLQQFILGVSRHNFELSFQSNKEKKYLNETGIYLSSIVNGFIQNYSLACFKEEGRWLINRWGQIDGVVCENTTGRLYSYFRKEKEFQIIPRHSYETLLNKVNVALHSENKISDATTKMLFEKRRLLSTEFGFEDEEKNNLHLKHVSNTEIINPRGAIDSVVYNITKPLLFLLHDYLTVISINNASSILAQIILIEKRTHLKLNIADCFKIYKNRLNPKDQESLVLTLFCNFNPNSVSVVNLTIDRFTLEQMASGNWTFTYLTIDALKKDEADDKLKKIISKTAEYIYDFPFLYVLNLSPQSPGAPHHLTIYSLNPVSEIHFTTAIVFSSASTFGEENSEIMRFDIYNQHLIFVGMHEKIPTIWTCFVDYNRPGEEVSGMKSYPLDYTFIPIEMFLTKIDSGWLLHLLTEDAISEFIVNDLKPTQRKHDFKYSMICDRTSKKSIYKHGSFLLLYCFNSTADDGIEDDCILLYNENLNRLNKSSFIYPVQQYNFPDVDSTANKLLTVYSDGKDGMRFLLSTSQTLVSQFHIIPKSEFTFDTHRSFLRNNTDFSLTIQNVMASRSLKIKPQFHYPSFPYWQIVIYILMYIFALGMLLSVGRPPKKALLIRTDEIDKMHEFESIYNAVMKMPEKEPESIFGLLHLNSISLTN